MRALHRKPYRFRAQRLPEVFTKLRIRYTRLG